MSRAPETKLVLEWGEGFQKRDASHLAKYLHKDFRYITLPHSLERKPQTKDEWITEMSQIFPLWAETEHTQHSLIEAPGKVVYHFSQRTKTTVGVDMVYEAIDIVDVEKDEDGNLKIKQIQEFIDSKAFLDSMAAFQAVKAK